MAGESACSKRGNQTLDLLKILYSYLVLTDMAVAASNHRNIPTKAFVVSERGASFTLQDVILDGARPDEVLVEMKYTGICHTVSLPSPLLFLSVLRVSMTSVADLLPTCRTS